MTCNRTMYEKIGCFDIYRTKSRQMFDELVLTDRDWTAKEYSGQDIDWFQWDAYIHG